MQTSLNDISKHSPALVALIAFQIACSCIFVFDVIIDVGEAASVWSLVPEIPEIAATLGLLIGIIFELRYLRHLLRRQETMARGLGVAAGALSELMEGYFRDWGLTSAEQDVAAFTIKGYSIAEIAELRGSAEATVKTHLNAIYRKAGVPGRGQLVSLLIEDLMRAPLVDPAAPGDLQHAAVAETSDRQTYAGIIAKTAYTSPR